jgi:hypothetical protein
MGYWLKSSLKCSSKVKRCPDCKEWLSCIEKYVQNDAKRVVDVGLTSGCVLS